MNNHPKHVLVIGGGVIGAVIAYFLTEKGCTVTIVEKEAFGQGSSHGNCGLIVPTHIFPLNSPGNLADGIKWMLKPDAPLLIKPRMDLRLFQWLLRFVRCCTRRHIRMASAGRAALIRDAITAYGRLFEREPIRCGWRHNGALHLCRTDKQLAEMGRTDSDLAAFGITGRRLTGRELTGMAPAVNDGMAGAWFYRQTAHMRPDAFMEGIKRVLVEKGVTVVEHTPVTDFRRGKNRAVAAVGRGRELAADRFVVATGAWTPLLDRKLGCRIPIQPGKGYSLTLRGKGERSDLPCFFEEAHVVYTPWSESFRLGGTMEFAGYDTRLRPSRLRPLFKAVENHMGRLDVGQVEEEWCGWRPMTPDGMPIIDWSPRLKNVLIAAGHNMEGLSMAPATGRLAAEMICCETPHVDPAPYRVARFTR